MYNKNSDDYCYYLAKINIKKYRNIANITQQQLADKSEFSLQLIKNLESLKVLTRPRLDTLYRIAKALNIDIRQLFDEID